MQNNHRSRIQFEIWVGQLPVICRSGERSPKAFMPGAVGNGDILGCACSCSLVFIHFDFNRKGQFSIPRAPGPEN